MIFTASRASFLIVVAVGLICYLYCSFCIYVHQIFTCFNFSNPKTKRERMKIPLTWAPASAPSLLVTTPASNSISQILPTQMEWYQNLIDPDRLFTFLWWVLLGFVFCIMHNWLLYIWLESVIRYCYDEYLCIVLSNDHLNNIYKQ